MQNKIYIILILVTIFGCGCIPKKAFQPSTPAFKHWQKLSSSDDEIKAEMLSCGYSNPYATDRRDTTNDVAVHEICMFDKGFQRKSEVGYKGICYLSNWNTIPACVEYRKMHSNPSS